MTRINCVPPEELHDRHLVAEYHELPRVFGLVKKAISRKLNKDDFISYDTYTFGSGHVKFFYTRLKWLAERQALLIEEMLRRKMRPRHSNFTELFMGIGPEWFGDWSPTEADKKLNRARLGERLEEMKRKKRRVVMTPYNEAQLSAAMEKNDETAR